MYKSYNPKKHNRKSIRLKGYDYTQPGLYFITLVTENRAHLYGEIEQGKMILNVAGRFANECWINIPQHFPNVVLHEYIIMPNHIHGIIELTVRTNEHSPNNVRANNDSPLCWANDDSPLCWANDDSPLLPRSPSRTIGSVIRGYKIGVTKWFRQNTNIQTVWQRNYYEQIIRDERSYYHITKYIINNPIKWNGGPGN